MRSASIDPIIVYASTIPVYGRKSRPTTIRNRCGPMDGTNHSPLRSAITFILTILPPLVRTGYPLRPPTMDVFLMYERRGARHSDSGLSQRRQQKPYDGNRL